MAVFWVRDVVHPFDELARRELESMPQLGAVLDACGSAELPPLGSVRLGPEHQPEIYRLLAPISAGFGIACPELLLAHGSANTYTIGPTRPSIILFRGLVDQLGSAEIEATLARECGHILMGNVPLRSVARLMAADRSSAAGAAVSQPASSGDLRAALSRWAEKSELSADRAAAAYLGNPDAVTELMFRVAGLPPDRLSVHSEPIHGESIHGESALAELAPVRLTPGEWAQGEAATTALLAVRVREVQAWTATAGFARLSGAVGSLRVGGGSRPR